MGNNGSDCIDWALYAAYVTLHPNEADLGYLMGYLPLDVSSGLQPICLVDEQGAEVTVKWQAIVRQRADAMQELVLTCPDDRLPEEMRPSFIKAVAPALVGYRLIASDVFSSALLAQEKNEPRRVEWRRTARMAWKLEMGSAHQPPCPVFFSFPVGMPFHEFVGLMMSYRDAGHAEVLAAARSEVCRR